MKKSGASELLTKENYYFHSRTSFWREEMGGVLAHRLLLPGWGEGMGSGRVEGWEWRGLLVTPLVDQKFSERLMKIIFLGKFEIAIVIY